MLERVPTAELANQVLYNLSEVYGAEQRYVDQLELLRTIGRLGRISKRWHTPGEPLSIVVQDSDLGVSRGHARIPVRVTTEPGGDVEIIYLRRGGAGKGLFRAVHLREVVQHLVGKLGRRHALQHGAKDGSGLVAVAAPSCPDAAKELGSNDDISFPAARQALERPFRLIVDFLLHERLADAELRLDCLRRLGVAVENGGELGPGQVIALGPEIVAGEQELNACLLDVV